MVARCSRCRHWTLGVESTPSGSSECSICKELHDLVQLLVAGGISLVLEEAIIAQLRGLSASLNALIKSSAAPTRTVVDQWLDRAASEIRTSPPRELPKAPAVTPPLTGAQAPPRPAIRPAIHPPRQVVLASGYPKGATSTSFTARYPQAVTSKSGSPSWVPTLRSRSQTAVTPVQAKVRPATPPPQRESKSSVQPASTASSSRAQRWEAADTQEVTLSPRSDDSDTTEFSDSECEPELPPGEAKLTRGLKRRIYLEIKTGTKVNIKPRLYPRSPSHPPPIIRERKDSHRTSSEGRYTPAPRHRGNSPRDKREYQHKEKRKDRRDSRERGHRRRGAPSPKRIPAPGTGKHFGKNKGAKKRKEQEDRRKRKEGHSTEVPPAVDGAPKEEASGHQDNSPRE
jgi:hypothetical protein